MHPFGGTPICPRCSKAVYAAEQIMGPGRKLYHKPCLACTSCNKRLDSYTLLEHDQQPYCKNCHVKNFGTRDLRQANLPHRDDLSPSTFSPPASPARRTFSPSPTVSPPVPSRLTTAPVQPARRSLTEDRSDTSVLKPTRALSPIRATFSNPPPLQEALSAADEQAPEAQTQPSSTPTHTGRVGGLPRTVPLTPLAAGTAASHEAPNIPSSPTKFGTPFVRPTAPLLPSRTGTRYGAALSSPSPYSPASSPAAPLSPFATGAPRAPLCGRCGKTVYFAEQQRAIGKIWHKGCLRCSECNTLLDSSRLTEKEGSPFCNRCYGKLHGPQGGGYALLGKSGA